MIYIGAAPGIGNLGPQGIQGSTGPVGPQGPAAPIGAMQPSGFRAHKSAVNQTGVANSAWTKVTFGTEVYDQGSYYDAPSSRWIPQAGLVHLDLVVTYLNGTLQVGNVISAIYKNGALLGQGPLYLPSGGTGFSQVSLDDVANGTDYYEAYTWVTAGAPTGTINGAIDLTYFSAHVTGGPKGDTGTPGPAAPVGAMQPTGFRAHKNGVDQTGIASNVATKLTFGFEDYDYGGYYDTVGSRWIPPAGLVHFDIGMHSPAGYTVSTGTFLALYKNGVLLKQAPSISSSPAWVPAQLSVDDLANGFDYYEVYVVIASASTSTVSGSATYTYFSAHVTGGPKGDTGTPGPSAPIGAIQPTGFKANKNAVNQATGAGAYTKITCTTEEYDYGGYYDAPNSRWIPPAGLVHIDASIYGTGLTSGPNFHVVIYKNGVQFKSTFIALSTTANNIEISMDDIANGTDYYEFYSYTANAATIDGGVLYTWWSGHVTGGPKGDPGAAAPVGTLSPTGFLAHKNTIDQTGVVAATWTKVTFPVENYDLGGFYDTVTSRWTPPAGIVHLNATIYVLAGQAAGYTQASIYKNGVQFKGQVHRGSVTPDQGIDITIDDIAGGTDYYECYVYVNSGATATIGGSIILTHFSGHVTGGPKGDPGPLGPPAPEGAIASTGFRAHKNAVNQALAGGWQKATFTTEYYDSGSYYDAPNSRWIPPAGIVHIDSGVLLTGLTAGWQLAIGLYKNGVLVQDVNMYAQGTSDGLVLAVDDVSNGTDYYEIYVYSQGASTIQGTVVITYFGGHVTGGPMGPEGPAAPIGAMQPTGFRAHRNGVDQTGIANGTLTKVILGTEDYDYGGYYDAPNGRWIPPAGLIHIDASAWFTAGLSVNTYTTLSLYKNGVRYKDGIATVNGAGTTAPGQLSIDELANGFDYYELYVLCTTAATATLSGNTLYTRFSGHVTGGPKGDTGTPGPAAPIGAIQPTGFRAVKSVDQTGIGNAYTKLTFPTEEYDYGNYYDAANSRWIPPAGLVHIDGSFNCSAGNPASSWIYAAVYKNGVILKGSQSVGGTPTVDGISVSVDDISTGTDYYELYCWIQSASSTVAASTSTRFSGHVTGGPKGDTGAAAPIGALSPTGFRAHKNSVNQTGIVTQTNTKITFPVEEYDLGGFYDTATSRWTPPAGLIHMDARAWVSTVTTASSYGLHVYKNGVLHKNFWMGPIAGFTEAIVNYDDVASGTDYYELYLYMSCTAGLVDGNILYTYWSGHVTGGPKGDPGPIGPPAPVGAIASTGFRAHKNAVNQALAGSWQKVTFTSEYYDSGSYYDAPNSRWIPPAGIVHIDSAVFLTGLTAAWQLAIGLYKNGVLLEYATNFAATTSDGVTLAVDDVSNGTDYYEIFVYTQGAATLNGTSTTTYFGGHVTGGPMGPQGPAAPAGAVAPTGFRAHKNGVDQTGIANVTYTKITFLTEDYDHGGFYDAVNSRWIPPAGLAHIDGVVFFNAGATANWYLGLCIYKNNLLYKIAFVSASAASTVSGTQISVDDVANGTDFYELYIYAAATAGVIDGRAAYTYFSGHVTGGPKGDVGPTGAPGAALAAPSAPQGRLTLQSGTPVLTTTTTGISTVRYTPSSAGDRIPIWDGTNWTMTGFTELSNVITDTTKNPAAVLPEAMYDMYVWDDSGTVRLSRGPPWLNTATVTISIATPAVITWNNHGLHEGSPVIFSTTGALPTGIVAGTIYYVSRSPTANTFNISTTIANSAPGNTLGPSTMVNTSGTQSGVQTGINRDSIRGTGAGTTELVPVGGFKLNANSITNGPAAQRGTWVGCIRTNAAGTIDWRFGSLATGGAQAAFLYVWNAYNRVDVFTTVIENVQSWTSSLAGTFEHSPGCRVNFISGWAEDPFDAEYCCSMQASAGSYASSGIGYDQSNGYSGVPGGYFGASYTTSTATKYGAIAIGAHFVTPAEGVQAGTNTVFGYYTGSVYHIMGSAFHFRMRM